MFKSFLLCLVSNFINLYPFPLIDSYHDIEMKFGNRIYTDSPSKALINELGALNMTAEELTRVLDQLKLERVLMYLKKYGKFFPSS